MRKLIIPFLCLTALLNTSCAQNEIDFKNEFLSSKEYIQETTTTNVIEVKYSGSEDFLNYLKSKNIENPQNIENNSTMKIAYRTGEANNNIFPIEIEYIETGQTDPNAFLKNGDKVFGTYGPNNSLKLTDLSNERLNSEDKNQFLGILESGFSIELFKGKKMKIGDTLITKSPMSFPIAGTQLDLIIESTYKLHKIKNEIAYFNITQLCKVNSVHPEVTLTATGGGNGKCTYSIKENHFLSNTTKLDINMVSIMPNGIKFEIVQKSTSNSVTEIK